MKIKRINRKQFTDIFEKGLNEHGSFLYIKYISAEEPGVSVVIPKKIIKTAFKRNLIKRRIRELAINLIKKEEKKYKIIFFLKKDVKDKRFVDIENEVSFLLGKLI